METVLDKGWMAEIVLPREDSNGFSFVYVFFHEWKDGSDSLSYLPALPSASEE